MNNANSSVKNCLIETLGGDKTDEKYARLDRDLQLTHSNTFWNSFMPYLLTDEIEVSEALHGKPPEWIAKFESCINDEYPLFVVEKDDTLRVVTIDYKYLEPTYNIHLITSERGVHISSLTGVKGLENVTELAH